VWICLSDGFISVVMDKNNTDRLLVRARRRIDLENVVGSDAEIMETPERDYRWRSYVDRAALKAIVNARIDRMDYTNFENSVGDADLHGLYVEMWGLHNAYGQTNPAVRRKCGRGADY